jgi:antitoxin (DNA-binding transcriptional repressor) of toxin-antitoxin stability system
MSTVTVQEAQAKLKELIDHLRPGEELVITEDQQPVATLIGVKMAASKPTRSGPGLYKGAIVYMAPDFDAPSNDFRDYTE